MDPISMLMGAGGGGGFTDTATSSASSTGDFILTGGGGSMSSGPAGSGSWKTWLAIGGGAVGVIILGLIAWKLLRN